MGHYAARKIFTIKPRQASPAAVVHSLRHRCFHRRPSEMGEGEGGEPATHSTAHASDIISHVTLIFESKSVRGLHSGSASSFSASQYSFLPSFLPSISSRSPLSLPFATRQTERICRIPFFRLKLLLPNFNDFSRTARFRKIVKIRERKFRNFRCSLRNILPPLYILCDRSARFNAAPPLTERERGR